MFKNDDIVICIDKSLKECTYGKKYKIFVIDKSSERDKYQNILYIYNNKHKLCEYYESSFISLKEYRKQKLMKINGTL